MNLHSLLKSRFQVAKKFTQDFHKEVKRCVEDYKADNVDLAELMSVDYVEIAEKRYQFIAPLIFTNHEAMLASMFDRPPDLLIKGRGQDDEEKKNKINAAYEYLVDKLNLEGFMNEAAWWFILTGFASAHLTYKQDVSEVPVIDEMTGEPVIDVMTNTSSMRKVYDYDDPEVKVGDPLKEFYSPESLFSVDAKQVPFYLRTELMDPEEVKQIWKKKVEPDSTLEVAKNEGEKFTDLKRVMVYFYYGTIPAENKGEVQEWEYGKEYYVVFTEKEILFKDKYPDKMCRLLKWYGPPNEFFGFGVAKILRAFQREKSIRRGQQIRYADVAAFPKLAMKQDKKIDIKAWQDPRENTVAMYEDEPPQYVTPPDLSNVLTLTEQSAEKDAQQASGMMDLSQGSQQSTVKTATGQTIFAEASERRMRLAKKKFSSFYRSVVIGLLKLAQEHWEESKLVSITDDQGNTQQLEVSRQDLQDIDMDTDIDIDVESLSINKDVLRQQAIELYNITKDDPLIERREVFKDLIRTGFSKNDPERYIKDMEIEPGTMLVNPQTNEQYTIDESGAIVSARAQQTLSTPTGGPTEDISGSQPGVLGGIYK